ncbi:tyrosine protein phosphatase yvh1, partial [Linderina macrospora]
MDKIIDGLFVGSAMAESDLAKLQENGITHILTVASNYAPSYPNHFAYKSISIEDMEQENIIQYFPECNEYIREAISSGGQILVHCLAGQSRSATVSLAYMMQRDGIGRDEALAAMKARRPQVHPNPGFMDQLDLYYDLRYEVSPSKPLYRRFLIDHSAEHFREYGSVGHVELGNDPLAQPMPAQRMWRCKKCRRPLVTEAN